MCTNICIIKNIPMNYLKLSIIQVKLNYINNAHQINILFKKIKVPGILREFICKYILLQNLYNLLVWNIYTFLTFIAYR
jgi:hypothetical protein